MPDKTTLTQRALIILRQRILGGGFPGGARLFEVALAEDLGISRTPVRAALSKLAEEGLLDRASGGGFLVRSFELGDVLDTIELRGVLEGTAARFAAERGATPEDLATGAEIIAEIDAALTEQPVDMEKYSSANTAFHMLLARMAQSPALARELARVTALPFAAPSAFLADEGHAGPLLGSLHVAQEQHRGILDAIAAREGARAEALAREHARTARRNVAAVTAHGAPRDGTVAPLALLAI